MFKKILIPLDGSTLAERAIAPAIAIAKKFGSKIVFLRILVPEESYVTVPAIVPQIYNWQDANSQYSENEAESYLDGVRLAQLDEGYPTETIVLRGMPAAMIVAAASEQDVDLIVMSTHGRTGLSRFVYGSVAEAVMRGVHIPVLLVPNRPEH